MKLTQLLFRRLLNQCLFSSHLRTAREVVSWFGAVQSQDYYGAKWALSQRINNPTSSTIESAFNAGEILRTHVMRPTWHFVAPDDIRWLVKLTGPRVKAAHGSNFRKYEVDDALARRTNRAIARALDDKQLSRGSLREVISGLGVDVSDPVRMAHILLRAELDGVICSGARKGNQFTYTLLDSRATNERQFTRDESLAELTLRFFQSHGPATLRDFVWWSSLTARDAKRGLEIAGESLVQEIVNGTEYFCRPHESVTDSSLVHLLPAYDEYLVAYKDRKELLGCSTEVLNSLWLGPAILVAGKVVGSWKATKNSRALGIELSLFTSLSEKQQSRLKRAVNRYTAFVTSEASELENNRR